MAIAADIAGVYDELGVSAVILRTPTSITEKILTDVDEQVTSPFVAEYVLFASCRYNTSIVVGDILTFNSLSYLVARMTPDAFQAEIVEYVLNLVKCNFTTGKILTPNNTQNTSTYVVTKGWTVRKSSAYGLIFKRIREALKDKDETTGKEPIYILDCLVPASYNAAINDRVYLSATEYYRVQDVEKYEYPGLHVLFLVPDERGAYTP